ncbi:hypothetical protein EPN95_01225 [Patescibacteria group bacterium]|nr:MAG: hypothetical protein EPN95_01225 [Patescibacteria group bacterium]
MRFLARLRFGLLAVSLLFSSVAVSLLPFISSHVSAVDPGEEGTSPICTDTLPSDWVSQFADHSDPYFDYINDSYIIFQATTASPATVNSGNYVIISGDSSADIHLTYNSTDTNTDLHYDLTGTSHSQNAYIYSDSSIHFATHPFPYTGTIADLDATNSCIILTNHLTYQDFPGDSPPDYPVTVTPAIDYSPSYSGFSYFNGIMSFKIGSADVPGTDSVNVSVTYCDGDSVDHTTDLGYFAGSSLVTLAAPPIHQGSDNTCVQYPPSDWRQYKVSLSYGYQGAIVSDTDTDTEHFHSRVINLVPTDQTAIFGDSFCSDSDNLSEDTFTCYILGDVTDCESADGWLKLACPVITSINTTTTGKLVNAITPLFSSFLVNPSMNTCPSITLLPDVTFHDNNFDFSSLPTKICSTSTTLRGDFPIVMVLANFFIAILAFNMLVRLANSIFSKDSTVIEDSENRNDSE